MLVAGLWPSPDVSRRIAITPVLSLLTHVGMVKVVPGGRKLSYGSTYVTEGPTKLATLPRGNQEDSSFKLNPEDAKLWLSRRRGFLRPLPAVHQQIHRLAAGVVVVLVRPPGDIVQVDVGDVGIHMGDLALHHHVLIHPAVFAATVPAAPHP